MFRRLGDTDGTVEGDILGTDNGRDDGLVESRNIGSLLELTDGSRVGETRGDAVTGALTNRMGPATACSSPGTPILAAAATIFAVNSPELVVA